MFTRHRGCCAEDRRRQMSCIRNKCLHGNRVTQPGEHFHTSSKQRCHYNGLCVLINASSCRCRSSRKRIYARSKEQGCHSAGQPPRLNLNSKLKYCRIQEKRCKNLQTFPNFLSEYTVKSRWVKLWRDREKFWLKSRFVSSALPLVLEFSSWAI